MKKKKKKKKSNEKKEKSTKKLKELLETIGTKPLNERIRLIEKHFGGNFPRMYATYVYFDQPNYKQVTGKRSPTDINRFNDLNKKDIQILKDKINNKLKDEDVERFVQLQEMKFTENDFKIYLKKKEKQK